MLSINIEKASANSRLIMTLAYKVLIYNYITFLFCNYSLFFVL